MRIAVIGARGMLGREVVRQLEKTNHDDLYLPIFHIDRSEQLMDDLPSCDMIINCAGSVPQKQPDIDCMIHNNSVLPYILADFDIPMIHVSTDCVFSGLVPPPFLYSSDRSPDPNSPYGMTKALGEVQSSRVMNIRTSFIGRDHGLYAWLLENRNTNMVIGWTQAWWSGSSAKEVAKVIVGLMDQGWVSGTYHLATEKPISKYDLLCHLVNRIGLRVNVVPNDRPIINRGLVAEFVLPPIDESEL